MVGTGGRRLFLKDALWGGGGTHRSWPGGRGGRPRASRQPTTAGLVDGGSGRRGKGSGGGGAKASVPGGYVVETRAPGTEQISGR